MKTGAEYSADWRRNHPEDKENRYIRHLVRKHGISREEAAILVQNKDSGCDICDSKPSQLS